MNRRVTRAGVTLAVALAGFSYEIVLGGGRPAVLSACVTLALVTPATALDAYRRGKALTTPSPAPEAPE